MEEIYKSIKKLENKYSISNIGNIKSNKTNKILKKREGNDGYFNINLLGKQYLIHKLVIDNFSNDKNYYLNIYEFMA